MKTLKKIIAIALAAAALTLTVVTATAETDGAKLRNREDYTVEERILSRESLEDAIHRFRRQTDRNGVRADYRKREHYEKPSVHRKKKPGRRQVQA